MIEEILNWLLKNSPTLGVILVVILGILFGLQLLKDVFDLNLGKIIKNLFKKEKTTTPEIDRNQKTNTRNDIIHYTDIERFTIIDELENDDFFQEMKKFRQAHILSMDFGSPNKNIILRDIIRIYIESIELSALKILRNVHIDELSTSELTDMLSTEIDTCSLIIYSKMESFLGKKLYYLLIESPKGFKSKNSDCREILIDGILSISAQSPDKYYSDNYDKAKYILTSMCAVMKVSMKNFEKVFKDFNGDLDELLKDRV